MTRCRILIVDDDALQRELYSRTLSPEYDIVTADTGAKALTLAPEVDLLLLDVGLPDIDGVTVCTKLKARPECAHLPILMITARSGSDDHVAGLAAGAVDFVSKPVSLEVLKARVHTHILIKQQRDTLERLATLDGLTEIPNRRSFDHALLREWDRHARTGKPLSLILLDVDHFKQFNDTYGHGLGDDCLKRVASAIAGATKRPADMAARYGGEEFAVLLPETNLEGATTAAEDIRKAVSALRIPHRTSSVGEYVTISLGVAQTTPTTHTDSTAFIAAADAQLYAAKKAGRSRVSVAVV